MKPYIEAATDETGHLVFNLMNLSMDDLNHAYDGLTLSLELSRAICIEAPHLVLSGQLQAYCLSQMIIDFIRMQRKLIPPGAANLG